MEVSKYFLNILKSIDYHIGHLPKELFANEEQLPELLPIFTWFINNVTPASNCVTPKQLTLFASISSKHDNYSSLEKVSKAIESFYDENTKNSKVCSLDLETLEKNISKSQKELDDLKSLGNLYERKIKSMDDEISLLKQQENSVNKKSYKSEKNLFASLKKFTLHVDLLKFYLDSLHNEVISSMNDDNECYIKLASVNLINLTEAWRQQIFRMINLWFKEESGVIDEFIIDPKKIQTIILLSKSVSALIVDEINEKCDIAKLKVAITNVLNVKNNFIDMENLSFSELDTENYCAKFLKQQDIPLQNVDHSPYNQYNNLQNMSFGFTISAVSLKKGRLIILYRNISVIKEAIEYYIITSDVLWCLMRISCSSANLTCELVLRCIGFLECSLAQVEDAHHWLSSYLKTDSQHLNTGHPNTTSIDSEVLNFNKYKRYSSIYTNSDEIEKLSKMVQSWKSKYHYSRDECNKLNIIQQKLQDYCDTFSSLTSK